jgi:hypothetical protein
MVGTTRDVECRGPSEALEMLTSRTIGWALAALGLGIGALVPVFALAYPAAGISPGDAENPAVVLPVIATNPALVVVPGAVQVFAHAIGIVAIAGLWVVLGGKSMLLSIATVFGIVWLGVDVVLNAITYRMVPALAAANAAGSATAQGAFVTTMQLVDAARLGAHVAGGLWMVGVAAHALQTTALARIVGWLGIPFGGIFAANLFLPALMNISFLTVPAWLLILGVAITRAEPAAAPGIVELRPAAS